MTRFRTLLPLMLAAAAGCLYSGEAVRGDPRVDSAPPGPADSYPPPPDSSYPAYQTEAPPPPPAGTDVSSEQVFYDRLSPYGNWTFVAPYGQVWVPAVGYGWRPYYYGQWVVTDWGWTFASNDPWGWAGYHYGRWNFGVGVGWYWIPGTVWGPAWVDWRYGAGYVTWCPLGPSGVVFGYRHPAWVAVPEQHFTRPIATVAIPGQRAAGIVNQARPLSGPHATVARNGRFGPPVASVSRATGQQIRPVGAAQVVRPRPQVGAPPRPAIGMRSPMQPRIRSRQPVRYGPGGARQGQAPSQQPANGSGPRAAPPSGDGGGSRGAPPASGGGHGGAPHATSGKSR